MSVFSGIPSSGMQWSIGVPDDVEFLYEEGRVALAEFSADGQISTDLRPPSLRLEREEISSKDENILFALSNNPLVSRMAYEAILDFTKPNEVQFVDVEFAPECSISRDFFFIRALKILPDRCDCNRGYLRPAQRHGIALQPANDLKSATLRAQFVHRKQAGCLPGKPGRKPQSGIV